MTHPFIRALKRILKAEGWHYTHVADALGVSLPTVKRMLNAPTLDLARLEQLCQLVSIELSDLVLRVEGQRRRLNALDDKQERELVADPKLLLLAHLAIDGWQFDDVRRYYRFAEPELIGALIKLEKLRLLQLMPGNRIRLLTSPRFTWLKNGPIQRFFMTHLLGDFFDRQFTRAGDAFHLLSGQLHKDSITRLMQRLDEIGREFHELNERDRALPLADKTGFSLLVAQRPWRPAVFRQFEKGA